MSRAFLHTIKKELVSIPCRILREVEMGRLKRDHSYMIDERLLPEPNEDGGYPGFAWASAHRCVYCGLTIDEVYEDSEHPKECTKEPGVKMEMQDWAKEQTKGKEIRVRGGDK